MTFEKDGTTYTIENFSLSLTFTYSMYDKDKERVLHEITDFVSIAREKGLSLTINFSR